MLPLLFFVHLLSAPSKGMAGISKPTRDENLQEDALLSLSECAPLNLPSP